MIDLQITFRIIFVRVILFTCILYGCTTLSLGQTLINNKIKGISFLGPHEPELEQHMIDAIDTIHAEWIAIIPEATLNRGNLKLLPDHNNPNWSETKEGAVEMIRFAQQSGKRIMLKPQIVLDKTTKPNETLNELASYVNLSYERITDKTYGAVWRGDFAAVSEADWLTFEKSYTEYILSYAALATSMKIDLFCIGTELRESALERPQYWKALIQKVRTIYDGSIIYSANWDEYEKITFWKDLDYIGTNAYYPISTSATPTVQEAFENWRIIRSSLYAISKRNNRKMIITEFGYRNVSFTGLTPWIHDSQGDTPIINNEAQANLYEAFFKAMWKESWVAGGFGWNWIYISQEQGNTDFSVQGKPALEVMAKHYRKYH